MKDIDIRTTLLTYLKKKYQKHDPQCLVVDELGLCQGDARIDMAVVNGKLHGYEIKSEEDTLNRLPSQITTYMKTLDYVTVVANSKHYAGLIKILPKECGIMIASEADGHIHLKTVKKSLKNRSVEPVSLAQLLWKNEVISFLENMGIRGIKSKPRKILWQLLAQNTPLHKLNAYVRKSLKQRPTGWRAGTTPLQNGAIARSFSMS